MFELGIYTLCIILMVICFKIWVATRYWKRKGVPYDQPWLIMGNMGSAIFKKEQMNEFIQHLYKTEHERYYGIYYFTEPCIVLKDLDLIKQVTVKQFHTFPTRSDIVSQSNDPVISNMLLFMADDEKWRNIRSTISPAFVSTKVKTMFRLINNCAMNLITYLEEQNGADIDAKNIFAKYTTDVIGNCVGFSCNSFGNTQNEFLRTTLSVVSSLKSMKLLINAISPTLSNMLKVRLLSKKNADFWINFTNSTITSRENGASRDDMVQLLLKYKEGSPIEKKAADDISGVESNQPQYTLTNHDIACQTLMVLLAGNDTSSAILTFAAYELAINCEIQTRLQEEIDEVLEQCGENSISFDELMKMEYLNAVVSETLRKWPITPYLGRKSKEEFVIKPTKSNEKPLILEPGFKVWIPLFAIHRDPKYHPDPERFNPERFYGENKLNIAPFTYFPFGLGPRSCLGNRLALFKIKLLLFHILAKFNIVPVENTPIPMITKGIIITEPAKKCWLGFNPRK